MSTIAKIIWSQIFVCKDLFSLKIVSTYCKDLKNLCPKLVNFAFRFHAQICVCKHFIMQRFPQMFSNFQVLLFIIQILWNLFMIFLFFISSWSSKKMWVPTARLYSKMKKRRRVGHTKYLSKMKQCEKRHGWELIFLQKTE